jgi:hypothetical protein
MSDKPDMSTNPQPNQHEQAVSFLPETHTRAHAIPGVEAVHDFFTDTFGMLAGLRRPAALFRELRQASWRWPFTAATLVFFAFIGFILGTGRTIGFDVPFAIRGHWGLLPFLIIATAFGTLATLGWLNHRTENRGLILLRRPATGKRIAVSITRRHDSVHTEANDAIDQQAWLRVIEQMPGLRHDSREYNLRNPVTGKTERRKAGPDTGLLEIHGEHITIKWVGGDLRADALDTPDAWRPLLKITRHLGAAIVVDESGERIDRM